MGFQIVRRILAGQLRTSAWRYGMPRTMASTGQLINLNTDESTGVTVLEMNRPPVNSLNIDLLTEMNIALEKLDNDKKCRGLILSSSSKTVFSAGLDIMEMYDSKEERLRVFWRSLQNLWIKLYGSRLITISAINGHSPAGGCLLALCCDYRVMAEGKYAIGLNETLLGIVAPFWFVDTMKNTIGQRETDHSLQLGLMYPAKQALHVGLVDEVVPQDKVMEAAKREMEKWLKIPDHARVLTKDNLRRATIQKLVSKQDEDLDTYVQFIQKPSIQKTLAMYLESMKKKK